MTSRRVDNVVESGDDVGREKKERMLGNVIDTNPLPIFFVNWNNFQNKLDDDSDDNYIR